MNKEDEIIREEIQLILDDIIKVYESSGRKASGQFEEGLEAIYEPYKATIRGFTYLAGRGKTKKGHKAGEKYLVESILEWLKYKGIKARSKTTGRFIKQSSLAWAIATKIHREGTKQTEWLKIYEQVITPERIDKIIDRISELNVNRLITEIRAELQVIEKNV